jgi:hypothetical protein
MIASTPVVPAYDPAGQAVQTEGKEEPAGYGKSL